MTPILTKAIVDGVARAMRKKCPHCKKSATYPRKRAGQFYQCKQCGHRFKEKGK